MKRTAVDHQSLHERLRLAPGRRGSRGNPLALIVSILGLLIITLWSYWPTVADLLPTWQSDDDYSAGQLVPLIAGLLLWRERRLLRQCVLMPCWSGGIALLVLGGTAQIVGFLSMRPAFERYALVLTLAGVVLLVTGWQVFRRIFWILLFLLLMVPLPGRAHDLISLPLQKIATTGSAFLLEAFGTPVSQQGNVIVLKGDTPLAVAEACSGLRMLIAFVIATALIAYLVKRPRWQKAVLLASSIPVAVVCNVIRIFVTALLMLYVGSEVGQKFFHDIGGFVMIAIAVSLLFGEIRLMDGLIVSEPSPQPGQLIVSVRSAANG
jgi:exosortase